MEEVAVVEQLEKLFETQLWKTYDSVNTKIVLSQEQLIQFRKLLFENKIFLQTFFSYVVEAGLRGDERVLNLIEEARKKKYKEIASSDNLKKTLTKHEKMTKETPKADLLYEIINEQRRQQREQQQQESV